MFQALQEQCCLWERGPVGLNFLTFTTFYMQKNLHKTLKEIKELEKQNRSPAINECSCLTLRWAGNDIKLVDEAL